MRVVIAPDSYKESLTALEVAKAIQEGFSEVFPDANYVLIPVADGGEGTVTSIIDATQGRYLTHTVIGPLGDEISATYGITGDGKTAVIEMAAASGLMLVPKEKRNPFYTTSFGTGQLILDALNHGVQHFILGIGGSATNDGGIGMMQALGARFLNAKGESLPYGGKGLIDLDTIDLSQLDERLQTCQFNIACDVDNPLTGDRGASAIFGPQKGATPEMVKELDCALKHYGEKIKALLGEDIAPISGAGAAGGMGAATLAFLKGTLRPGIEIVIETVKLEAAVKEADLVITGEGRVDEQTIFGKTPIGVAKVAKQYGKPVIAIAGCLGKGHELTHSHGIDAVFSITSAPMTLEDAYQLSTENLKQTARNIASVYVIGQKVH